MIRRPALLSALAAAGLLAAPAAAGAEPEMEFEPDDLDDDEPEMEFEPDDLDDDEPEMEFEPDELDDPAADEAGDEDIDLDDRASWDDIVVVERKPFLKQGRFEFLPVYGTTTNDPLIRHDQLSLQINYFLTEVLAVGVEGSLFQDSTSVAFDQVPRQARRLPTVNRYNYNASLNFHYTPVQGKFALFDRNIVHWDATATAGVGVQETEVIPRDPGHQAFDNTVVTPNVGAALRVYLGDFMTAHMGVRDYIFLDRFEDVNRTEVNADAARENADTALINHLVFQAGVSFWLPTSFSYSAFQ